MSEDIINSSEWYKDVQYKDAKNFIKENINAASRSFVAIGYYLKYIRDKKLYEQDGYQNIWEFAQAEFGISKSSASRFMAINDRFSVDGNSPILQDRYKDFSSSKLSEMLTMTDEQLEQVTVTTTVAEIREIKNPDKVVATSQQEAEIIEEKPVETKPYHSAEYYLRETIRNEEKQIEAMRDYWKEYQPDTLLKHETILRALKSYLADINSEQNPPEQIQPELPILRNNDQRAAWIDAFETWPIWIDTKETEERYYRYDLPDGNSIVVKVYYTRLFDYKSTGLKYEERFKDGWGDEEYYLLEPNKHFKQCRTNRSYLIDYLKELQRKKGDAYAAGNS